MSGVEKMPIKTYLTDRMRGLLNNAVSMRLFDVIDRHTDNRMSEKGMLRQAFEFQNINQVKGDYFEFGLWKGKTFCLAHRFKHQYRRNEMTLWGFDSFRGLPPIDDKKDNVWSEGEYAFGENEFRTLLQRKRFKSDEYELVPGFYQDSLTDMLHERMLGRKAAIVYIDCDLYQSTTHVLSFIKRYLVNGSIVCFDDFYCYKAAPDQGEQRALGEFLRAHPSLNFIPYMNYCPVGSSFIVRHAPDK